MTLPAGWADTTLGQVIELKYGRSLPEKSRIKGPHPVYGSNGVVGYHTEPLTYGETIIVGRKGSAGKVHFSAAPCFPIDTTYFVDDFSCIHPGFATTLLRSLSLDQMDRATAVPGLNREDAYALNVPLPPLAEQRRIVAKLNTLTARLARARAELARVSALAEHLRQSAVTHAFDGRLTAEWRATHPDHAALIPAEVEKAYAAISGSTRRKPATGIEWKPDMALPRGWRWASVDELVAIVQYGSSAKTSDDNAGIPVLRMGNIQQGEIDWSNLKYLPADDAKFPQLLLQAGDVLFNRTNSFELVGKSAVFRGSDGPASYASYLIRLRCSAILPDLLVRYINSPYGRAWVRRMASQQVGQANINGTKLKSLGVPLPSPAEQLEMLRLLDTTFTRADRLEVEAEHAIHLLDRLEAAILAKAFRGELVPQDPKDEPAAALLARIRASREEKPKQNRKAQINVQKAVKRA